MEHLLLKAATTATDQGTFEAVISTATVDRDKDIVEPAAMVDALAKWATLGKLVPLAWAHQDEVIGHVDPASVRIANGEVIAKGWIDQTVPRGEEAWRLVKSGTLSFSFGYLIPDGGATKRSGGGLHINALDVYEISAVPMGPSNNDTRVLDFKSAEALRKEADEVAREAAESTFPTVPPAEPDAMTVAFKDFDPAGKPATEIAEQLNGLSLDGGRLYVRLITEDEDAAVKSGLVKAVWTTAYINDLPDSAFLHVESGGSKDPEGKTTPRSLRHFPYKDANGTVDLPHLRNALSRIPQSSFPQNVKDTLTAKAQRILDAQKSVDVTDKEPKARSVDPLRKQAESTALEFASGGLSQLKPPRTVEQPTPEPELPLGELKRRMRDEMLRHLSGEPLS